MTKFFINKENKIYTGDMQDCDRLATQEEIDNHFADRRSYSQKRADEYPALGDIIDAFCKAEAGNRTELESYLNLRNQIKQKYPKN